MPEGIEEKLFRFCSIWGFKIKKSKEKQSKHRKTKKDKQFDASLEKVKQFVTGCIEKQRRKLTQEPALNDMPENMLQIMLIEQNRDPTLTDNDILANALTLLLAGEDTTANTLAWMSYLVSGDQSSEADLSQELQSSGSEHILPWPLPRVPYTTAIMYEAMRLKPVAPNFI